VIVGGEHARATVPGTGGRMGAAVGEDGAGLLGAVARLVAHVLDDLEAAACVPVLTRGLHHPGEKAGSRRWR